MKIEVAKYIAEFLVKNNIRDCFTVVGGGAMFLNDAFGHNPDINVVYQHHEQACAMSAEAYARINNQIALVCVTTGPGATNAITGVLGGWMDSIPMLVISGQARYKTTSMASKLPLRTRGIQEYNIIESVKPMTKYAKLVDNPLDIKYVLEKAVYEATTGRPGPCWIDIPLDVQSALIDTDELSSFEYPNEEINRVSGELIDKVHNKIMSAKRPLLFIGNGVRLAGAHEEMLALVEAMNIPVVTGMSSVDAIDSDHPLFIGRNGTTGSRAGNFAVQTCDLLLSIGSRQSYFQTGFDTDNWAPNAFKILNDIDINELNKEGLNPDLKLCCDAKFLITELTKRFITPWNSNYKWIEHCQFLREKYPVLQKKHIDDVSPNIYNFYDILSSKLSSDDILVVSVGTSRVAGSQASRIKEGMRFITNPATASMGYCLPAAIGVSVARNGKKTILVTGEGSFQMNIQELQTIVQNKLPIIIFVMNNQGYHSIRMTQNTYFGKPLVGVGPESNDLSFPDLSKIAYAYGMDYKVCNNNNEIDRAIDWALEQKSACICEIMLSTEQITEPKVSSQKLENGQMKSARLENMSPFLNQDEIDFALNIE